MAKNQSSYIQEAFRHLRFIDVDDDSTKQHLQEELATAPLFSALARQVIEKEYQGDDVVDGKSRNAVYPQYGLLGLRMQTKPSNAIDQNELVYANVSAPWSAFICGSQGSGKSHTLSCMLENALIGSSPAGRLSSPLAGMVLHYDKFTAFSSTQLCEAAYLCSSTIPVQVLVSPSNYHAMKNAYENLPGLKGSSRLRVLPLYLPQKHLNISMMKTLMGIHAGDSQPLYVEVVIKILREMARTSQGQSRLDYNAFKLKLENECLLSGQNLPLKMRLEVLESFFEPGTVVGTGDKKKPKNPQSGNAWNFTKGSLTIVDLSCPFIGPDDACALFNICISLFLKGRADAGRIIALDEAHKFLTQTSSDAGELTETLLSIVRQQRHLGARVMIATQEPTISPDLLDLCNLTVVHRFTSPAWYKAIEKHIAGAANVRTHKESDNDDDTSTGLFQKIVRLATGEALVFCPTALVDVSHIDSDASYELGSHGGSDSSSVHQIVAKLGSNYIRLRIRKRITADGGRSQLAD